jgi:chloride channel 7
VFLQSLDYDICENHLLLEEERTKGYKFIVKKNLARWMIFLLIGMLTALIACVIDITIEELSLIKFKSLKQCILCINTMLACGSFSDYIIN